ncbi:MAG: hypothetical protein B7Z55_05985 [Planctomycetales bacterium 12-60-4]|nr:MAG: hypothetical protein B7Z55_05985 [Planctomycetales bacterium 12-60-4]
MLNIAAGGRFDDKLPHRKRDCSSQRNSCQIVPFEIKNVLGFIKFFAEFPRAGSAKGGLIPASRRW